MASGLSASVVLAAGIGGVGVPLDIFALFLFKTSSNDSVPV